MQFHRTLAAIAAAALTACVGASDGQFTAEAQRSFVGGWDGAHTRGTAVLLLRDDLSGTLGEVVLVNDSHEYELNFSVQGELDGGEGLQLSLSCAEARLRSLAVSNGTDTQPEGTELGEQGELETPNDDPSWSSVDCAGWELELMCDLAGDCESKGCNLICDVAYFGEAYAKVSVSLGEIEDEFDMWSRV